MYTKTSSTCKPILLLYGVSDNGTDGISFCDKGETISGGTDELCTTEIDHSGTDGVRFSSVVSDHNHNLTDISASTNSLLRPYFLAEYSLRMAAIFLFL